MDPVTWFRRRNVAAPLTPLGVILLTIFGLLLLIALALVLGGCAFTYDRDGVRLRSAVGCVNVTGPGFSLTCPDTLRAPDLPDSQRPPVPPPQ